MPNGDTGVTTARCTEDGWTPGFNKFIKCVCKYIICCGLIGISSDFYLLSCSDAIQICKPDCFVDRFVNMTVL